jgi:hypothetical protein
MDDRDESRPHGFYLYFSEKIKSNGCSVGLYVVGLILRYFPVFHGFRDGSVLPEQFSVLLRHTFKLGPDLIRQMGAGGEVQELLALVPVESQGVGPPFDPRERRVVLAQDHVGNQARRRDAVVRFGSACERPPTREFAVDQPSEQRRESCGHAVA